jgi:exodeoxyribonuclease X
MILNKDIIIIDTETTSPDPETCGVVEVAAVRLSAEDLSVIDRLEYLVDPECDIDPGASAVHHLTREILAREGARPWNDEAGPALAEFVGGEPLCAHNAEFDRVALPAAYAPWLCTLRLSRHLWPRLKSHGLQYMRYHFGLQVDTGPLAPHRAMADVLVLAEFLRLAIAEYKAQQRIEEEPIDVFELIRFAQLPISVQVFPFGKHRGTLIEDVPRDYIQWALNNIQDMDQDLRHTLQVRLGQHVGARMF